MIKKVNKKAEKPQSLLDRLEEDLERDNIYMPEYKEIDADLLNLPSDLTDVDSKDLGQYLNAFTQQKVWIRTVIGRTTVALNDLNRQLDEIKAVIYTELPVKMSVKEKELSLLLNKNAKEIVTSVDFYTNKLTMLDDIIVSMEESIFAISREISRRGQDFKDFNREESVGWGRPLGKRK